MNFQKWAVKAQTSGFYRKLLSYGLNTIVPFNNPHKIQVVSIGHTHLKVKLPYRKRNLNHLKGLHACALATIAEVSSGLLLMTNLDAKNYRLILKSLEMIYHYQAKMDAYAHFEVKTDWLENTVIKPLKIEDAILIVCEVQIHDADKNYIATGKAEWQIKNWKKVKTL